MAIHLLSIGCNYAGESCELPDCELDAELIAETFEPYVASGKLLIGKKASARGIVKAVKALLEKLKPKDLGLISFSGHGTRERKGAKYVEAIVANDLELIYEFELRDVLNARSGGILVMLADCCHSGGLSRNPHKVRTIPSTHCFTHQATPPRKAAPRPNAEYLACQAKEYAFSTGVGGAMTLAIVDAFGEHGARTSLQSLHRAIRTRLPSPEWDQHPQFVCRDKSLAKRTIRSFV